MVDFHEAIANENLPWGAKEKNAENRFVKIPESFGQKASSDTIGLGISMGNLCQLDTKKHGKRMETNVAENVWCQDGKKLKCI